MKRLHRWKKQQSAYRGLLRTVRYVYTNDGDAVHIVLKDEWTGQGQAPAGYDHYYALRLVYAGGGTLWLAVAENWENGWAPDPADASHTAEYVREFRYDAPRQRYMVRDWDPVVLGSPSTWLIDETSWTDYLGMQPYVDYDVTINGRTYPKTGHLWFPYTWSC